MSTRICIPAILLAALPALPAQDENAAPPNPKTLAHDALAVFAGEWKSTCKMTEPGKEPTVTTGTEHAELICDGLYLKASIRGEYDGQPFHGTWLVGYDPLEKRYRGLWVDSMCPSPSECTGSYDPKSATWSFSGDTPMGRFTSELVIEGPDRSVETCVCTDDAGNESRTVITRERAKVAEAAAAVAARPAKAPTAELAALYRTLGDWDAVMKVSSAPGAPKVEMPGRETNELTCGGRYVWSDYRMDFMGTPFEGHALCGHDAATGEYVCYWFDSMSPTWSASRGSYDADEQSMVLEGASRGTSGKPATTREVTTWKDPDTRHMTMEVKGEDGAESFEITFTRKK